MRKAYSVGADVERAFSILSHIRDQRCSRLTPKHIEDKLRIRINGPTPEKFNSVKYAKTWVKAGKMRSDDPTHLSQSKRQRISNEKGEETADEEYKYMDNSPLFWNMVKYRQIDT